MMPPKVITLILLILGLCQGSYGLKPLIRPNTSEVLVNAGDPIYFECIHSSDIFFLFPKFNPGFEQEIVSLQAETQETEVDGRHKYIFSRRNATPSDTGWYGCVDHNVTITPDVYYDPEISWLYFYVTSPDGWFVEEHELKTIRAIVGANAVLPCRPTSPNLEIVLSNEETGEEVRIGENVTYDPKFGFKLRHVIVRDSGFYRCLITKNGEERESSYHLRVQRNITLDEPIINNDTLRHVIRGQNLHVNCSTDLEAGITHKLDWNVPNKSPRTYTNPYFIPTGSNSLHVISELVIENITDADKGEYECYIKTFVGRNSKKTYINLHDPKDKYIRLIPQNTNTYYSLPSDGTVKWIVSIDAFPPPELQWISPKGEVIPQPMPEWVDHTGLKYNIRVTSTSTILTINHLAISDIGVYTLQATNEYNLKETLNITLDVLVKPIVLLPKIEMYYPPNRKAEITCDVTAFPPPQITWNFLRCPYYPSLVNATLIELESITKEPKPNLYNSTATIDIDFSGTINCTACNSEGCDYAVENILVTDGKGDFGILPLEEPITEGDNVSIICAASIYNYTDNVVWIKNDDNGAIDENGSMKVIKETTPYTYRSILNIQKVRKSDTSSYTCSAKTTDGLSKSTTLDLIVHDMKKVSFIKSNLKGKDLNIDLDTKRYKPILLMCYVDGMPKPNVTWYKDGVMLEKSVQYSFFNDSQELHIQYLHSKNNGKYSCIGKNRLNSIEDFTNIIIEEKGFSKVLIVTIVILFIIVVILVIFFTIKVRREKILRKELLETGLMHFEEGALECLNPDLTVDDQAELLPYDKKWEFPRERLKLGKQLGSGAFGVVMKAEAQGICEEEAVTTVAVKMVRRTTDPTYVRALASELKIMVHLGKHLNVVNLLGACTKNISKRELLVIVEYCRFGNLHNYLLRHRADFINQIDPATGKFDPTIGIDLLMRTTSVSSSNRIKYAALSFSRSISANSDTEMMGYDVRNTVDSMSVSMSPDGCILSNNSSQPGWRSNYRGDYKDQNLKPICTQDLLSWAFQVARGMEYLSQRKVLHGDLAARNILLAEDNIVKICDFGLAKTMYKDDNYKKKGDGPLPIKWMAIESIRDRVFSTQSDTWSFGIVLWEFFTLAETPYPGMEAEKQYQKLIEGYRMEQPGYATSDVYKIMLQCWKAKPTLRPSFTELVDSIGDLLEESVKAHYISLNTPYMDMNTMILEGKNDYLTMMSAPDHVALSSPTHNYINSPTSENVPESSYLCMSPTNPREESGIFSPRPNFEKSRFEFPSVTSDSEDAVELSPMLKNEEDPYLKPINVQERRSEFARQRQAAKKLEIDQNNDRDSGYSNAPRNLHLIDLKQTDVDDNQDEENQTESSLKKNPYSPAIIRTPDNYVNMPKQKSDLRRDMPDSFSNPSYIMMGKSEVNQTKV